MKTIITHLLLLMTVMTTMISAKTIDQGRQPIRWQGRCLSIGGECTLLYTMQGFKFAFSGTGVTLHCKKAENVYLGVKIDNSDIIRIRADKDTIVLAKDLRDTRHNIELYKLTEREVGTFHIRSIEIEDGDLVSEQTEQERYIEFIGNSITCGYGNMVSLPADSALTGFHPENENGYMAYGAMIARKLGMSYSAVAWSGRGLLYNNDGSKEGLMPQLYEEAVERCGRVVPEIIVVNLGTNDFFALGQNPNLFTMKEFTKAYRDFVKSLRKRYPKTKIVCVTGSMMSNNYPEGREHLTKIIKATNDAVKGMKNVERIDFTPQNAPFGEDFHPTIETHHKMCDEFIHKLSGHHTHE